MKTGDESIHIVTTLDSNYIQHCGVMLSSLFLNNPHYSFTIWLIIDFEDNRELKKLSKFIKSRNHLLKIIKIGGDQVRHFQTVHHITTATYYRLLIPDLVDLTLKRILYLDVDIIVKQDIFSLWSIPLDTNVITAVTEHGFNRHSELRLNKDAKYFNAGVLLINLEKWREKEITKKILAFLEKEHQNLTMLEQDALNIILADDWKEISLSWNLTTNAFGLQLHSLDPLIQKEIEESIKLPNIIHYTGSSKPWHYLNTHPLKQEYYYYLSFTPWKSFKHIEETHWHKIKQRFKRFLNLVSGKNIFEIYN
ncbi:glycosyltransferase family 8 protein [Cytophagaceae bacterium YF14B1]|uniref:Glycosyltransferase family 8 protein n=1 Tax=Xanthocytophaga flava TaxID=3048013 RepID=A0AAE3QSG3_9BACT|nr:glycosyltransferase family 8 protein [Xanthocytophaga flavus]MDJ1482396.1 glycosyltransferase family 8 protein [Xanthocytophaga flavus]